MKTEHDGGVPGFLFKPVKDESPDNGKQRLLLVRKDQVVAKRGRSSSSASSGSESSGNSDQPLANAAVSCRRMDNC